MTTEMNINKSDSRTENIIQLQGITKIYNRGVPCLALDDISLSIPKGSFTAITGPSGSGKSTLLNLIGGLDRPTNGSITVDQHDLSQLSDEELAKYRNRTIGFVFQSHYLLPEFTVRENILMPYRISERPLNQEILAYLDDLILTVGLSGHESSKIHELSGGEQQRVAIARALINRPPIILADEPGSNLDSTLTRQIYSLLYHLNTEYNMTIVVITHKEDLNVTFSRIFKLKDGKIEQNTTEE